MTMSTDTAKQIAKHGWPKIITPMRRAMQAYADYINSTPLEVYAAIIAGDSHVTRCVSECMDKYIPRSSTVQTGSHSPPVGVGRLNTGWDGKGHPTVASQWWKDQCRSGMPRKDIECP